MRAAIKEGNVVAAPHHAAVQTVTMRNQNIIGARPKYADSDTTAIPPAPSIKRLPTKEWLTTVCGISQVPPGLLSNDQLLALHDIIGV